MISAWGKYAISVYTIIHCWATCLFFLLRQIYNNMLLECFTYTSISCTWIIGSVSIPLRQLSSHHCHISYSKIALWVLVLHIFQNESQLLMTNIILSTFWWRQYVILFLMTIVSIKENFKLKTIILTCYQRQWSPCPHPQ